MRCSSGTCSCAAAASGICTSGQPAHVVTNSPTDATTAVGARNLLGDSLSMQGGATVVTEIVDEQVEALSVGFADVLAYMLT